MKKLFVCFAVSSLLFLACHKNAVTGRSSLNLIPESDMNAMGKTEYQKFLAQHPPIPISDSRALMVKNIGARIQKAVESYYAEKGLKKQLDGFEWEFNLVEDKAVNAWCMPGGKVVVYTGILPVTGDEPSLAIVMGHEIAHAIGRHGTERMSQGILAEFGGLILATALQTKPEVTQSIFNQAYGITAGLGILAYSRKHESEADHMGIIFAAIAGYNPEVAVEFWQRMAKSSGGAAPPEFLSTHPSDETRINDLKALMPEAKKYYKPR